MSNVPVRKRFETLRKVPLDVAGVSKWAVFTIRAIEVKNAPPLVTDRIITRGGGVFFKKVTFY